MRHESRMGPRIRDRAPDPGNSKNGTVVVYAATVLFLTLSFFMLYSSRMLSDGATYWELVVGGQIFRTASFPIADQFSHTQAGAPWIAKELLSQVFFYIVYSRAGWFGVSLL